MDEQLQKAVEEIAHNHRKIIDDWCKAYLAQLYEEKGEIKPGDFILVEQVPTFDKSLNCTVKKYWFEERKDESSAILGKNGEWKKVDEELPEQDGTYEITNFPNLEEDWIRRELTCTAYYDGYGFEYLGVYRTPSFWRKYEPMKKKYGKVKG